MRIGDEPVARFGACSLCGSWESVRELRNAKPGGRRNLYDSIISGRSDANIPFEQTVNMLKYLGFDERIGGATTSSSGRASRR